MLLRPPSVAVIIAEAAIGLAIVVVFRKAKYVDVDDVELMKG
jgi:NADH:ubiquinone oxidoreductase subunit K